MADQYPATFEQAWHKLRDTPVNEQEEIDEPFLDFEPGTNIYQIWHWLEEHYNISIGKYQEQTWSKAHTS